MYQRLRVTATHLCRIFFAPHVLYAFAYEIVKVHLQAPACFGIKSTLDLSTQKAHNHTSVCYERSIKLCALQE